MASDDRAAAAAGTGADLVLAVGSLNPSKTAATLGAGRKVFPGRSVLVEQFAAPSGVSDQPKSGEESMRGALNRAKEALRLSGGRAEYGVGLEGGIEKVGGRWFECGWIAVVDRDGREGLGTSARFEVSDHIVAELMGGRELAEVVDELSGKSDVRSSLGMMGIVTNGCLPRADCYEHGVIMAFAKFVSPPQYWD